MGERHIAKLWDGRMRRGREAEHRVLEAMVDVAKRLSWVDSWRPGDRLEDGRGIDMVVVTDAGDLFVQVKSGRRGANAGRYTEAGIGVVVAGPHRSDWEVEGDLCLVLSAERARVRGLELADEEDRRG